MLTEGELLYTFYQLQEAIMVAMTNFVGFISAALLASYLAADKLDRFTVAIAMAIFTFTSIGLCIAAIHLGIDIVSAGNTIAEWAKKPGSGLIWHSMAKGLYLGHVPFSMFVFFSTLYGGATVFFFRLRWARMKKRGVNHPHLDEL